MTKARVLIFLLAVSAFSVLPPADARTSAPARDPQVEIVDSLMQEAGGQAGAWNLDSYPMPAKDFDGDGRPDILMQSGHVQNPLTISAIKGNTGSTLWSRTIVFGPPADVVWNVALPVRVGATGQNGVLAIGRGYDGNEEDLHLAALSSDGEVLWRRSERGIRALGAPMLFDVMHANGAADDILIGWVDSISDPRIERIRTAVVAGEDGSVGATASALAIGGASRAVALGDMTQDGFDDYAIIVSSGESVGLLQTTIYAIGGTDGTRLWRSKPPSSYVNDHIVAAGDVNGDGRDDVALGRSPTYPATPNVSLLNGANGDALWHRATGWITGYDDVDGNGLSDVMTFSYSYVSGGGQVSATLQFRAINGAGNDVYSTARTVSFPVSGTGPCVAWTRPGDVNVDHRADIAYHVYADCRYGIKAEAGVVSGATGTVLWSRQWIDTILGGAVDGAGSDVAIQVGGSGTSTITVLNGATGGPVWSATVPRPVPWHGQSAFALDADGDGRADVVPVIPQAPLLALRGTDGSVLWSH